MSAPIQFWAVIYRCSGGWAGMIVPTKGQAIDLRARYMESGAPRPRVLRLQKAKKISPAYTPGDTELGAE